MKKSRKSIYISKIYVYNKNQGGIQMKKLINKLIIKSYKMRGYESFTITIDGKVKFIHFYKNV